MLKVLVWFKLDDNGNLSGFLLGREEAANALERVVRFRADLLREHPRLRAAAVGRRRCLNEAGEPLA